MAGWIKRPRRRSRTFLVALVSHEARGHGLMCLDCRLSTGILPLPTLIKIARAHRSECAPT